MEGKGLIHLYVGDGKGKTTAATGLALRALGNGKRVVFAQFLKGRATGETAMLEKLGAAIVCPQSGGKFIFQMTEQELAAQTQANLDALEHIIELTKAGCDLLVLDEAVDAAACGLLPLEELLNALNERPAHLEVVLTGRNPPVELVGLADYHTEFICKCHPYHKGVPARKGIEF